MTPQVLSEETNHVINMRHLGNRMNLLRIIQEIVDMLTIQRDEDILMRINVARSEVMSLDLKLKKAVVEISNDDKPAIEIDSF